MIVVMGVSIPDEEDGSGGYGGWEGGYCGGCGGWNVSGNSVVGGGYCREVICGGHG